MNFNKKKVGKVLARTGAGFLAFAGTLVGGYMLTPSKVRTINLSMFNPVDDNNGGGLLPTHFQQFVTKLTNEVGLGENEEEQPVEKEKTFFKATLDNFNVKYELENSNFENNINLNGEIDFMMHGLTDINFNLDADVNYNGKDLALELGYFDKVVYFGLKDLRLKCSQVSVDHLKDTIIEFFYASDKLNLDVDKMVDDFSNLVSDKLDGLLDIDSLIAKLTSGSDDPNNGTSFNVVETQVGEGWQFTIEVDIKKKDETTQEVKETNIDIVIDSDANYNIQRVDLGTIDLGVAKISGAIDFEYEVVSNFVKPENRHPERNYNYVEIFNYSGWLEKLSNFLGEDQQNFGIAFDVDLDDVSGTRTDIAKIEGSINADFNKLIDLSQYLNQPKEPVQNGLMPYALDINETLEDLKDKVGFNLQLDLIGQNDVNYANLALVYANGNGYLNFNEHEGESVMKFVIDTETINWLINELPATISDLSGDSDESSLSSLFSFVTDSDFVKGIKKGDYSVVLDLIETLRNTSTTIELGLDLSSLGLGDEAAVNLTLDSSNEENHKVLDLVINKLAFGDFELNASIESTGFTPKAVGDVSTYDSLSFVPSVVDQVAKIVKEQKAGFAVEGSVLDEEGLGIKLYGNGQFDNNDNVKEGYGELTIDQYKYHSNSVWCKHRIALDVNNLSEDKTKNNALFAYKDMGNNVINGKVTIQSVLDMVDVVKTFVGDSKDDPKFTKFLAPITKLLGVNALADVIAEKNYLRFAGNDFIKKIAQFNNGSGIEIVVGGSLLGMDGDIKVKVNFDGNNTSENRKIESLELIDLVFSGKTINMKFTLQDYDNSYACPLNKNDSYLDLSSISILLELGINTTKFDFYHLTADANIQTLSGIIDIDLKDINVYVQIDGEHVKIYGKIGSVPLIPIATEGYNYVPLLVSQEMYSEFTFVTYDDNDPNREDGVGGYFHIKRTLITHKIVKDTTDVYHYKSTSKNFLDNIVQYLLGDMIGIKSNYVEQIGNISTSSGEKTPGNYAKLFTSTGYKYTNSGTGANTVKKFNIGLNLDVLTGIDALKTAEVELSSKRVNGVDYLHKLSATLLVHALVNIDIKFNATVASLTDSTSWNTCNSAFNAINNVNFPANKLDKPTQYINY